MHVMSNWAKHLGGGTVTLLCLFIIARQVNFLEILDALKHFQWPYFVLAIASLAFGYALRISRWSLMLSATGASIEWDKCAAPFLGSIALNNVFPLRLGDLVRAFVFPSAMGISRATATSSLFMERLIDLMTVLGYLSVGLIVIERLRLPSFMVKTTIVLAVAGGVILTLGFILSGGLAIFFRRLGNAEREALKSDRFRKFFLVLSDVFQSFEVMSRPRLLFTMMTISIFIWACEIGLFYSLLIGFGFDTNPALAMVVMAIATLSTLVPSAPGYVGPFHLAAFTAVSILGGTTTQAGSYAVLSHLALWLPTTIAGAIAIWMRPSLFRAIRSKSILK